MVKRIGRFEIGSFHRCAVKPTGAARSRTVSPLAKPAGSVSLPRRRSRPWGPDRFAFGEADRLVAAAQAERGALAVDAERAAIAIAVAGERARELRGEIEHVALHPAVLARDLQL